MVDFREPRPQGAAPSTRTRQKKEGDGRKKEELRKKERVRHVEKGTKEFEHASGQMPGDFG